MSGLPLFTKSLYGFDFSPIADRFPKRRAIMRAQMASDTMVAPPAVFQKVDCFSASSSVFDHESTLTYDISMARQINGFFMGFELDLADEVSLLLTPQAGPTSWQQAYFPMQAVGARGGDRLTARIRSVRDVEDRARVASYHFDVKLERDGKSVHEERCEYGLSSGNPTLG